MSRIQTALQERSIRTWLVPGLGVKRWFLLLLAGMGLLGLGIAFVLRELYVTTTLPGAFYYLTLQFLPYAARGGILMALAAIAIGFGAWKFTNALVGAARAHRSRNGDVDAPLVELLYRSRFPARGPRIVCIGGGTGLSILLRGLKEYSDNISAIVTVADDGGSSGRLRRDMGVIPPGDLRNCIAALADAEPLMTRLFQYRFPDGSGDGLEGHSFGNLFIVAMSGVTGSMEDALNETGRVLAVRGRIIPSTLEDIRLAARTHDGRVIRGESAITAADTRIRLLTLEPAHPRAHPDAVNAVRNADIIVVGPGSLYTSVLPNLIVPDLRIAFQESSALKMYVSNVATQRGETDHYSVQDHISSISDHIGGMPFDYVVANNNASARLPRRWRSEPVRVDPGASFESAALIEADVVDSGNRYRHDSAKLAAAILTTYHEREEAGVRPLRAPPATGPARRARLPVGK